MRNQYDAVTWAFARDVVLMIGGPDALTALAAISARCKMRELDVLRLFLNQPHAYAPLAAAAQLGTPPDELREMIQQLKRNR